MPTFTVVVERSPPGCSTAELHAVFSRYGPLGGGGIRYAKAKGDNRVFVDYNTVAAGKKALQALHGKSCPDFPMFKFSLSWSPETLAAARRRQRAITAKKAADEEKKKQAASRSAKRSGSVSSAATDELFESSSDENSNEHSRGPPAREQRQLTPEKKGKFSLAQILGVDKDDNRQSEEMPVTVEELVEATNGFLNSFLAIDEELEEAFPSPFVRIKAEASNEGDSASFLSSLHSEVSSLKSSIACFESFSSDQKMSPEKCWEAMENLLATSYIPATVFAVPKLNYTGE